MNRSRRILTSLLVLSLFILAISLRTAAMPYKNVDTDGYIRWYKVLAQKGFGAMSRDFSVYTPPYLYLLWLAARFKEAIPPLLAIKLIPTIFDGLSAAAVYKLARIKYPRGFIPWLAAAGFLSLPTVIMNSAQWGQIDSLYTSFLLWCVYFILTDRPLPAMLAFGVSLSVKGQAFFLLPFLGVMVLRKRLPWTFFLIPPLVYVLSVLPAAIAGRSLPELLMIYFAQAKEFPQLAMHAANLYSIIPYRFAPVAYYGGLAIAAIVLGAWTLYYGLQKSEPTPHAILLTALLSLVLAPFLLPKMHDRYFYPADILSYVMMFFAPVYGIVAAGYQLISSLVYYIFLHSVTPEKNLFILRSAVLLNTIMVSGLAIHQFLFFRGGAKGSSLVESQEPSS